MTIRLKDSQKAFFLEIKEKLGLGSNNEVFAFILTQYNRMIEDTGSLLYK